MSADDFSSTERRTLEAYRRLVPRLQAEREGERKQMADLDRVARTARDRCAALLAENDRLRGLVAELTAAVAAPPWRAENAASGIPLGTYAACEDARAHCGDHYRITVGRADGFRWYPETPDGEELRMYAVQPDGTEVDTVFLVYPLEVRTSFDPTWEG